MVPIALQACSGSVTICRRRVAHVNRLSDPAECLLTNGSKVTLAPPIAAHIAPGDASKYVMEGWRTGGDNRCFVTAIRLLSNGEEPVNPAKTEERFLWVLVHVTNALETSNV